MSSLPDTGSCRAVPLVSPDTWQLWRCVRISYLKLSGRWVYLLSPSTWQLWRCVYHVLCYLAAVEVWSHVSSYLAAVEVFISCIQLPGSCGGVYLKYPATWQLWRYVSHSSMCLNRPLARHKAAGWTCSGSRLFPDPAQQKLHGRYFAQPFLLPTKSLAAVPLEQFVQVLCYLRISG